MTTVYHLSRVIIVPYNRWRPVPYYCTSVKTMQILCHQSPLLHLLEIKPCEHLAFLPHGPVRYLAPIHTIPPKHMTNWQIIIFMHGAWLPLSLYIIRAPVHSNILYILIIDSKFPLTHPWLVQNTRSSLHMAGHVFLTCTLSSLSSFSKSCIICIFSLFLSTS